MVQSKKFKINDIAKDFNIQPQEVLDIFPTDEKTTKKPATSLNEEDANIAIETILKKSEVKSFDEYFAKSAEKPAKKEAEKAPKKPIEKLVKKPAEKAVKKEEKVIKKETSKPIETIKKSIAKVLKTDKIDSVKPNTAQTQSKAPNKTPAFVNATTPAAAKAAPNKSTERQNQYDGSNARAPKQVIKQLQNKNTNVAFKPGQSGGQSSTVAQAEKTINHVDTRTVDVNLDKYNERYEQIAPQQNTKKADTFQRKQKINQKSQQYRKNQKYNTKKETESQKLQRLALERARKQQLKIQIPEEIVVAELASRLKVTVGDVIKKLMALDVMATQTEIIDYDTAALVALEFNAKVSKEVVVTIEERLIDDHEDETENLEARSPVVVVMGHVDHGKTSLLDKIRNTDVTSSEAGGITQHIGAYTVTLSDKKITFLDTPGHEAFTSMRARGALMTDIAILVVAADDGIMPQTVEAINHAKAAGVQIIVAINKMDKPTANPERVKQGLTEHGLVPEEWGGDAICCNVSAQTGEGIPQLLEMVNLVADMADLKANPNRRAKGTVIEARLDKGRGPIATVLVQNGTLRIGDVIIAGASVGRVRTMTNDKGNLVEEAGPSTPVEITGLAEVPSAGDVVDAVEDERLARTLVDKRKFDHKEEEFAKYQKVTLDNLFEQIDDGEMKELPLIVKADVQGTAEAVKQSLEKLSNSEVRVRVIHDGVGAISESDIMLAQISGAIIIGFNVRPSQAVRDNSTSNEVEMRLYRIIYDAIDDVKKAMTGLLDPKTREVELGRAEVRLVYKITNVGVIAGAYVIEGKVARNALIRVVRDGIVMAEDKIDSLKRFKDDAKEVQQGFECGIGLDKFNDIKEGDILESFIIEEYRD